MNNLTATYIILGGAAAIGLSLFAVWIFAPAWTSYGRVWERVAAAFLSIFILFAFVSVGVGIGQIVILYWDDVTGVLGAANALT